MRPGENSYSASSDIWQAVQNNESPQVRTRRLKKSEIIHHVEFDQAIAFLDDPYWIEIFKNCARKKIPRGFAYADRQLKFRKTGISLLMPDNPRDFANTAVYFFQENGRMYSDRDQNALRRREEEMLSHLNADYSDWSKVAKSKYRRTAYIREFVNKKFVNFPQELRDENFTRINLAFELKILTKEHVIFSDNKIMDIKDILVSENGCLEFVNKSVKKISKTPNSKKDVKYRPHQHIENWEKYLENYRKHLITTGGGQSKTKSADASMMPHSS